MLTTVRVRVMSLSKFVLPPMVFDTFIRNSILYKGPAFTKSRPAKLYTYLQCNFNVFSLMICFVFSKLHKMRTHRSQLDTLHGARVHETSLCVASAAPRFGTNPSALSQRSKYGMFSITFGTPVLQTPVCVASGARRACDAWSA